MPHRPAHDAAQHVAAPVIARHHTIRDQERGRAQVIRDHPVMRLARPIGIGRGHIRRRFDQSAHCVSCIIVVASLQQCADPLQPHAGVDRLHVQRPHGAVLELFVLHEDDVPDLDESVAVFIWAARRATPDVIPVIVENLGAGATGTGRPHLPEIVGGRDADDPAFRHADLFPDLERLVIGVVDRDVETLRGNAELLGDQFPGKRDRLFLEIIAKTEIAQHFKERVVARGIAHIVKVIVLAAGAHAFLRRGRALVIAVLDAREQVLELHHARVGEHQCRIVARHKRARGDDLMSLFLKVAQKGGADIVQRGHV